MTMRGDNTLVLYTAAIATTFSLWNITNDNERRQHTGSLHSNNSDNILTLEHH